MPTEVLLDGWHLDFYDMRKPFADVSSIGVDVDPLRLARANGAKTGTPIFVGPDGRADPRINRFWREPGIRTLKPDTKSRYAHSLRTWLNFLTQHQTAWHQATATTLDDFKDWRLTDEDAPAHVSANTFRADLAALRKFYAWAEEELGYPSPVKTRLPRFDGEDVEALAVTPKGVRRRDVKWLTPDAYRLWRDIGLCGFAGDGQQRLDWNGLNEDRDRAYADGLYDTGLRRTELASLLVSDVPSPTRRVLTREQLAAACAKLNRGRPYWVPARSARQLRSYIREGSRPRAVRRAQEAGRYADLSELWIVRDESRSGFLIASAPDGSTRRLSLDATGPDLRKRLYRETEFGLEPLWLWLNSNGLPRSPKAWNRTFTAANARVARALPGGPGELFARQHMLRHSFALRWYTIATYVAWQRSAGLSQAEQRDLRDQIGDVWFLLASLLGHRSPQTTRDYYLEPFQELQVDHLMTLMESHEREALERLVDAAVASEPRVLSSPKVDW